ncbi:MAG: glycosyltransferase [bacterium]
MSKLTLRRILGAVGRRAGLEISQGSDPRVISLLPDGRPREWVLLSYTINPFIRRGRPLDLRHTADWECSQIARTFLDLGYGVDVINYNNRRFVPKKPYAVAVDELTNLERLAPLLPPDCVKLFHAVFAHWLFHNRASYERYAALHERRGILLKPQRLLAPNLGIEAADGATVKGTTVTMETYAHAGRPMHQIDGSSTVLLPWPEGKDFEASRRQFIWLGSRGLVHKGLDLVLEAFAGMPDYALTVCGPVRAESDFESAFADELYRRPNIRTVGWVDLAGPQFREIAARSLGIVYPSCAEACAGSVINTMHAGLIPVVSRESGVDVHDELGMVLSDCSVEDIRDRVRALSDLPVADLQSMARRAWELARTRHTRERFAQSYREAVAVFLRPVRPNRVVREQVSSAVQRPC